MTRADVSLWYSRLMVLYVVDKRWLVPGFGKRLGLYEKTEKRMGGNVHMFSIRDRCEQN